MMRGDNGEQLAFPEPKGGRSHAEEAASFHRKHPEIYDEIVALARTLTAAGHKRLGIGMLWETMRYFRALHGLPDPGEAYKLNNNHRSHYSRMIVEREPDLADKFELRELRSI